MLLKLLTAFLSTAALVAAAPAGEEEAKNRGYDYVRNPGAIDPSQTR